MTTAWSHENPKILTSDLSDRKHFPVSMTPTDVGKPSCFVATVNCPHECTGLRFPHKLGYFYVV